MEDFILITHKLVPFPEGSQGKGIEIRLSKGMSFLTRFPFLFCLASPIGVALSYQFIVSVLHKNNK